MQHYQIVPSNPCACSKADERTTDAMMMQNDNIRAPSQVAMYTLRDSTPSCLLSIPITSKAYRSNAAARTRLCQRKKNPSPQNLKSLESAEGCYRHQKKVCRFRYSARLSVCGNTAYIIYHEEMGGATTRVESRPDGIGETSCACLVRVPVAAFIFSSRSWSMAHCTPLLLRPQSEACACVLTILLQNQCRRHYFSLRTLDKTRFKTRYYPDLDCCGDARARWGQENPARSAIHQRGGGARAGAPAPP